MMQQLLPYGFHSHVFIGGVGHLFLVSPKCSNNQDNFKKCQALSPVMPLEDVGKRCLNSISRCNLYIDNGTELLANKSSVSGSGEELSHNMFNESICELCRMREVDKAMTLLAEMEAIGYHPNSMCYVSLITALGSVGRTLEAEAVFQEMVGLGRKPRIKVVNAMLRSLLKKGLLGLANEVLAALDDMGVSRNLETHEILLDYYVHAKRLKDSWSLIAQMSKEGYQPNAFVYGKIIELYRDNGMWKKAISIVAEIQAGLPLDKRVYNSIIDTFGRYGELGAAVEVLKKMRADGVEPDIRTWNSLIRCHCKFGDVTALELLIQMQEQGLYPDPKIFLSVIICLGEQGKWAEIQNVFDNMKFLGNQNSGAIYAALVDIYGQYGKFHHAEDCIRALRLEGIKLSADLFCVLANAYAQQGFCEQTVKVLQLMEAEGIEPNLIMLNVLINAFGIAGRHLEALQVYHHIKESGLSPDVVTYSTLMKAFIRAKKFDQVPGIYREMESAGCSPDRKAKDILQTALTILQQRWRGTLFIKQN